MSTDIDQIAESRFAAPANQDAIHELEEMVSEAERDRQIAISNLLEIELALRALMASGCSISEGRRECSYCHGLCIGRGTKGRMHEHQPSCSFAAARRLIARLDAKAATDMPPLTEEDRTYLKSIEHITASLKPYDEARELAKGCPDPERYASEDSDW